MEPTYRSYRMEFEYMVRQVLGPKYSGCADLSSNAAFFRKTIRKIIQKYMKRVDELELDDRTKELVIGELHDLDSDMKYLRVVDSKQIPIVTSLSIIGRLLGYDYHVGRTFKTPIYVRSLQEQVDDHCKSTGKSFYPEYYNHKKRLTKERFKLVNHLTKEGYTIPEIGFIMKMKDHEVRKARKRI